MRRRQYLGFGLAAVGASVGARVAYDRVRDPETASTAERPARAVGTRPSETALPVPESALDRGAPRDAIPAIVDPSFGPDWSVLPDESPHEERELRADDKVLGVTGDDRARAYPVKVLERHEAVNDEFGEPLLVTYCPLCRSGVVARRHVAGETRTFGVSGELFRANQVLYDEESDSLWSQIWATAIRGPLTGTELTVVPSRTTTWAAWRDTHPETAVLLPPPASDTVIGPVTFNYELDVYGQRERVAERYPEYGPLGGEEWTDTRLQRRAVVLGVSTGEAATAYPRQTLARSAPINDTVGELPVVVALGADRTPVAYDRRIDGTRHTFERVDGALVAGGSRWEPLSGEAIDGPHEGQHLRPAPAHGPLYWAAWLSFTPETTVHGVGG